jgi:hypothetical protein
MYQFLFCLFVFLASALPSYASTLYAFIGVDTFSSLKYSCESDHKRMRKAIKSIAKLAEMKLHLTELSEKELIPHRLWSWLNEIEPKKDDVVFFYFSGHGRKSSNRWPLLFFTLKRTHVPFSEIITHITKKNARLSVILCDVCNGQRAYNSLSPLGMLTRSSETKQEAKGVQKLFKKKQGLIIGSASKSGQNAQGNNDGGIYTRAFVHNLQKEVLKEKPKWKRIFENTYDICKINQKPQVKIDVK